MMEISSGGWKTMQLALVIGFAILPMFVFANTISADEFYKGGAGATMAVLVAQLVKMIAGEKA